MWQRLTASKTKTLTAIDRGEKLIQTLTGLQNSWGACKKKTRENDACVKECETLTCRDVSATRCELFNLGYLVHIK